MLNDYLNTYKFSQFFVCLKRKNANFASPKSY